MTTHSAPPVVYPLGRSALLGLALFAAWTAGVGVCGYWLVAFPADDLRWLLGVAALLLAGLAAARSWHTSPNGNLAWDCQFWRWQSAGYAAGESALQLVVALDLQRVLWLRLENSAGASLWLWAEKSALPHRWMDLRRAVHFDGGAHALRQTSNAAPHSDLASAPRTDVQRPSTP